MKHQFKPLFLLKVIFGASIFLISFFLLSHQLQSIDKKVNQTALLQTISTNHTALTNQIVNLTSQLTTNGAGISSKQPHLISIMVGTTCVMQIRADNFSIKDGILSCQALNHDFHFLGSMHSIIIEEIKPGQQTITTLFNRPPERKEQTLNEKRTLIQ